MKHMITILSILSRSLLAMVPLALFVTVSPVDAFDNEQSDQEDPGLELDLHDAEAYIDGWVSIYFPNIGLYPLRDLAIPGSDGMLAFQEYGLSFDSFEPISLMTSNPNRTNVGHVVFMPVVRCLGDMNGDGDVNAADLEPFASAYVAQDPRADLTGNGSIDHWDHILFLQLVSLGCIPVQ